MNKAFFLSLTLSLGTGFSQVAPNPVCEEKDLYRTQGPSPYGPRNLTPPEHDLPADPKPQPIHKGVNLQVWHKAGDNFQVGGLAMLANGDMLELDYTGRFYHITGLDSAHKVTRRLVSAPTFPEALGLLVRNNREVFVSSAHTLYSFEFDGTNLTQQKEFLKVPKRAGWYWWNADLEADSTYLYAILNTRGAISRFNFQTATWELDLVTGMRNSHGLGKDDSGRIWFSDNQGNYRPACPIFLLKPGKAYGVPSQMGTTGAMSWQSVLGAQPVLDAYKSDMLWIPYNGMGQSATDIHFMKSGPFKGQALVGDNRAGHVNRLIMEKVDGQMQGAAIRMTGGLEAATYRISEDTKGNLYLGGLATTGAYWSWCHKYTGFQKLTFKPDFIGNKTYNDVLKVSLVRDGLVVEFTSDISGDFLDPANFRAYVFSYIKSVSPYYGGPKSDSVEAKILGIVKRSSREILISMSGLLKESLLTLEFGKKLTVENNLQSFELSYTMNRLSSRIPTDLAPAEDRLAHSGIGVSVGGTFLYVQGAGGKATDPLITDLAGKAYTHLDFSGFASNGKVNISPLRRGVYFLKMKVGNMGIVKAFVIR